MGVKSKPIHLQLRIAPVLFVFNDVKHFTPEVWKIKSKERYRKSVFMMSLG